MPKTMIAPPNKKPLIVSFGHFLWWVHIARTLLLLPPLLLPSPLRGLSFAQDHESWFLGATILVLGAGALIDVALRIWALSRWPRYVNYLTCASLLIVLEQYHESTFHLFLIVLSAMIPILFYDLLLPGIEVLKPHTPESPPQTKPPEQL